MTASFNTTSLSGQRTLVRGTDFTGATGEVVLSSAEWDHINSHGQFDAAESAFNEKVSEFFAPLTEAIDALTEAKSVPSEDEVTYVRVQEGIAPTAGQDEITVLLSHDSIVLRLIEEGQTDRLIWVNNQLEVVAQAATFPSAGSPDVAGDASSQEFTD